jgi:hypothetical protein
MTQTNTRGWALVTGVLAATTVVAAIAVVVLSGSSSASAVTLEPAALSGSDPFSSSVAIGPVAAFPDHVQAITISTRKTFAVDRKTNLLVASGTAPGLYGGSGDKHVCDPDQLVGFLQQNPAKAAAWAGVLGIRANDIASYVASLTPVLLTSDTLVTNHGYRDGHATTLQSVLEAGTAVLVDATGTPRVKCNCGNPLAPPAPISVTRVRGTPWPGYSSRQVTRVNAGAATDSLTLLDVTTGDTYTQPIGSGGTGTGGTCQSGMNAFVTGPLARMIRTVQVSKVDPSWARVNTTVGVVSAMHCEQSSWVNERMQLGDKCSDEAKKDPNVGYLVPELPQLPVPPAVADELDFHC